jgi:hypothetical protein
LSRCSAPKIFWKYTLKFTLALSVYPHRASSKLEKYAWPRRFKN